MIYVRGGTTGNGPSKVRAILTCPRAYAFSRHHQTTAPALRRGTLIHAGLAQYHAIRGARAGGCWIGTDGENRWVSPEDAAEIATPDEGILAAAHEEGEAPDGPLATLARQAVAAFEADHAHTRRRVLAVEVVVRLEIDGHVVTPRVDLIFQDAADRVWICDYKTTSKPDNRAPVAYTNDVQMLMLSWYGQRVWGPQFGGVLLAIINVAASPPTTYSATAMCGAKLVSEVPDLVRRAAEIDLRYGGRPPGEWPATPTDQTCVNRYRVCPHIHECKG